MEIAVDGRRMVAQWQEVDGEKTLEDINTPACDVRIGQ